MPSGYKKNIILFKKPKLKILFFSGSFFVGLKRSQIPTAIWSDRQRFNIESKLIDKVFNKIPYNILYKTYPLHGNLAEPVIKKKYLNIKIYLLLIIIMMQTIFFIQKGY